MNYHDKKFVAISNSDNGEISSATVFHYQQHGQVLTCTYSGGYIKHGHLMGLVDANGNIDMRYHQINQKDELMTGTCQSEPEVLSNGKIRLYERWQWTSGDQSSGHSILEEQ